VNTYQESDTLSRRAFKMCMVRPRCMRGHVRRPSVCAPTPSAAALLQALARLSGTCMRCGDCWHPAG
jgi:hypothetical protein